MFVEALKNDNTLDPLELSIYTNWFELMLQARSSSWVERGIYLCEDTVRCRRAADPSAANSFARMDTRGA